MTEINLDIQNTEAALEGVSDVARQARKNLVILDNQLLTLRLNFGKLRASIERAFAPITAAVAPVLNQAIRSLTEFCNDAGAVMAALFGTVYKKVTTTAKASGSAIRRTLASFDEIQRLGAGSGGSGGSSTVTLEPINDPLTPKLQTIVDTIRSVMDKIRSLIAPLKTIDFTAGAEAFRRLGTAITAFGASVLSALEGVWHTLLVPLAKWMVEEAVPASVDALTAAFGALQAIFTPVVSGFSQVRSALQPFVRFIADTALMALRQLETQFSGLSRLFTEKAPTITAIFANLRTAFTDLWTGASPALESLRTLWLGIMETMGTGAEQFLTTVMTVMEQLTTFVAGVAGGSWKQAWDNLRGALSTTVNGIIGLINSLLRGMASGLNAVSQALNSWSVKVPDWVPVVGGKSFSFHLRTITAPQIPYLAQGAVLPAGKPFLAMVGDQRHGTNIEAPLSTIQEAVALVMGDQTDAIMAGFSASVEVQREILSAVLGIRIGDEVIASAVDRYRSRQAVMKGVAHAL